MMKSLFLAFMVFVIYRTDASPAAQIELDPKCAQGQAYWCQSITIAKTCNAVKHCNQMVWNIPQIDKNQCKICFKMVQIVRDKLHNNSSTEHFKNMLKGTCDFARFESLKDACYPLVDSFIPQFSRNLYEYLDPQTGCGAECNSMENSDLTKSTTDNGIKQFIRDNEFISRINSIDTENEDIPCVMCTELLKNIKKTFNETSKTEFKDLLKSLCKYAQTFKTKCLNWIDENVDEIYNFVNQLEPESACLQIGFCSKKAAQYETDSDEEIANWNVYESTSDEESSEIDIILLHVDNGVSSIECTLCEKVMDKVQKEIGRDKSREHIKNALNHACNIVHERKFRKKCEKFMEKDGDKIIDLIIKGEASKLICGAIGFCAATPKQNELQMSPVECLECQHILKGVEAKVGNDRSKEHVEAVLQEQCSTVTNVDLKKKCFAFVQDHNDYIVNALMNNQPPKQICKNLKFCGSRPTEQIISQMMDKYSDTPQCVVCQMIAVHLDDILKKNSTIEEIDLAVHTVCKFVSKKHFAKCEDFVENYAELAISYLLSASPKQLCLGLNFCRAHVKKDTNHRDILECGVCNIVVDSLATVYSHDGSKDMDVVSETTCNLIPLKYQKECIELMEVYGVSLSMLLNRSEKCSEVCGKIGKCFADGDDSIFHEIKQAISGIPDSMDEFNKSGDLSQESDIFNFDDVTKNIIDKSSTSKPLLGAKKCTFGPKYWCSSKEAAEECNAHDFCRKYKILLNF